MAPSYLFKSQRLGFRNWVSEDIDKMHRVSNDPEVMRYFPATNDYKQVEAFVTRMQKMYDEKGYCYFAVEILETKAFIGFIGICYQDYEAHFTPCIDIGWRLHKEHWGNGYATEGAERCLSFAFDKLKMKQIKSVATKNNIPSINVMKKIGMSLASTFDHPYLLEYPKLKECVLYNINNTRQMQSSQN